MPDVLAIVSKAVFEKSAPGAKPGAVLPLDRYTSGHRALDPLGDGGTLFLVTVRPPDERLWLVAALKAPRAEDGAWIGTANTTPITDVSHLRGVLKFANGAGMPAKTGALGMSLQTPRVLAPADVEALRSASGASGSAPAKATESAGPAPKKAGAPVPAKSAPKAAEAKAKAASAKAGPSSEQPPTTAASPLRAALDLLPSRPADALARMLAAWRERPFAELADAIDVLSAALTSELPALADDRAFGQALAQKRPELVGQLLRDFASLPMSTAKVRMSLLEGIGPDPRICAKIVEWASSPPTTASSNFAMWTTAFDILKATPDARIIAGLAPCAARKPQRDDSKFWPRHLSAVERALKAIGERPRVQATRDEIADTRALAAAAQKVDGATVVTASTVAAPSAQTITGTPIERARTHLAADRIGAAIGALLELWREHRDPELGDLVLALSAAAHVGRAPPIGKPKDRQTDWLARFDRSADDELPLLLDALPDGPAGDVERRVHDVSTLPDDPRIVRRVVELAFGWISPERTGLWRMVFDLVARTRDVEAHRLAHERYPNLDARPHDFDRWRHARRALRPLGHERLEPPPRAKELATHMKALSQLAAATIERAEAEQRGFLAAILAEPESDAPRQVYADWLLERGNAHGELIQLQCAKSTSPRVKELTEHGDRAAAGPLVDVLERIEFERGFPVGGKVRYWRSPRAVRTSLRTPLWRLVRDVDFPTYGRRADLAALVGVVAPAVAKKLESAGTNDLEV